jgi:hypothetical protein
MLYCVYLQISSDGTRVIAENNAGFIKLWTISPPLEERITAAARMYHHRGTGIPKENSPIKLLPQFAQHNLVTIRHILEQRSTTSPDQDEARIMERSLDVYNATQALPDINASLVQAKRTRCAELVTKSIQRIADLQPGIRDVIYRRLYQIKRQNRTLLALPEEDKSFLKDVAFIFEHSSSIDERIQAITKTIEYFKDMLTTKATKQKN